MRSAKCIVISRVICTILIASFNYTQSLQAFCQRARTVKSSGNGENVLEPYLEDKGNLFFICDLDDAVNIDFRDSEVVLIDASEVSYCVLIYNTSIIIHFNININCYSNCIHA